MEFEELCTHKRAYIMYVGSIHFVLVVEANKHFCTDGSSWSAVGSRERTKWGQECERKREKETGAVTHM